MTTGRLARLAPFATALLLAACSGERVLVHDPSGRPIAGARVKGSTESLETEGVLTDAHGEASVPWTPHDLWFVQAWAHGYCPSAEVDVRGKPRPVTVVLQPRGTDACPNVLDRPGFDAE